MNNTCTNADCIRQQHENDEDIRLQLTIRESTYVTYSINYNGSLEYRDSDGEGQEKTIQCPVCGTEYEFDHEFDHIGQQHVLPLTTEPVEIQKKVGEE